MVSLVTRICDSYWGMSRAAKAVLGFPSIYLRFSKVSGCLGAKTSKFTLKSSNLSAKASGYF